MEHVYGDQRSIWLPVQRENLNSLVTETRNPWAAAHVTALPPVSHVPLGTPRKVGG